MSNPIPKRLREEFKGYMEAIYHDDDLPDGAWFAMLEDQAESFMEMHKLKGDSNDAAHQALRLFTVERYQEELRYA
jgi:hypothetical protein